RGLADNDDVLSEFLTAWSTMEGLDCVYRKAFPGPSTTSFKSGMKDVLIRLGRPEVFSPLEELRNDIAHGKLTLQQATQTAHTHLELIRKALVLMVLRILQLQDDVVSAIISQAPYKGTFRSHLRFLTRIRFTPADV